MIFFFFFSGNADGSAGPAVGAIPPGPGGPVPQGQNSAGGQRGPGNPPLIGQAPPPHALSSVMPPFMFRGGQIPPSGVSYPVGYQGSYGPRGPSGPPAGANGRGYAMQTQDSRYRQGPRLANPNSTSEAEQPVLPRPIVKEEDLRRMDEISGEDGWAAMQDEPDYERKLFDDDEVGKEKKSVTIVAPIVANENVDDENNKADRDGKWADNIQAHGRSIILPSSQNAASSTAARQGYQSRTLQQHQQQQQQTNNRPLSIDEDEFWREQRRQQKDEENKAAQRAKERR